MSFELEIYCQQCLDKSLLDELYDMYPDSKFIKSWDYGSPYRGAGTNQKGLLLQYRDSEMETPACDFDFIIVIGNGTDIYVQYGEIDNDVFGPLAAILNKKGIVYELDGALDFDDPEKFPFRRKQYD